MVPAIQVISYVGGPKRFCRAAFGRDNMRKLLILAATGLTIAVANSSANAQVDLSTYADAEGYIDVQALTCLNSPGHGKTKLICSPPGIAVGTTDSQRSTTLISAEQKKWNTK